MVETVEQELDRRRRLAPMCDKHGTGDGTRTGCAFCDLQEAYFALKQIQTLVTGEEIPVFTITYCPSDVVESVKRVMGK